jgi:hypothetical protein
LRKWKKRLKGKWLWVNVKDVELLIV